MKSDVRKVTPGFKISINMLALSKPELSDMLRREAEKNPWLEVPRGLPLEDSDSVQSDLRVALRNGRWKVTLNTHGFPWPRLRLTLKESQRAEMAYRKAQWLIESLRGFHRLLLSLSRAIIAEQKAFLEGKTGWPRRLTLAQLAQATGFHPSTVSRLLTNKKVEAPREIFSLGFLVSPFREPERIQHAIAQILAETEGEAITDREIARQLQSQGLTISRRTVCKLRNAVKIKNEKRR